MILHANTNGLQARGPDGSDKAPGAYGCHLKPGDRIRWAEDREWDTVVENCGRILAGGSGVANYVIIRTEADES